VDSRSQPRFPFRFRQDLLVTRQQEKGTGTYSYLVEDPTSSESFSFGEEEFFLCQAMDGTASSNEIRARFERYFGHSMTEEALEQMAEHVCALGLAERVTTRSTALVAKEGVPGMGPLSSEDDLIGQSNGGSKSSTTREDLFVEEQEGPDDEDEARPYHWTLFNPVKYFDWVLKIVLPFKRFMMACHWLLIIGFPWALYTQLTQFDAIAQDLKAMGSIFAYVGQLIITLFTLSALRATVEGAICAYHGAKITAFGFRLHAGCIPRFWVDRSRVKRLGRTAKLWIYSATILLKMYVITIGTLTWFMLRGSGTLFGAIVIEIVQIAMIDLFVIMIPVFKDDGSRWLFTFFGLPFKTIDIAGKIMAHYITGKPLVTTLPVKKRILYVGFSALLVLTWCAAFIKVSVTIGRGVLQTFPNIFGVVTPWGIFAIVLFFVLRWGHTRFIKPFLTRQQIKDKREEWLSERDEMLRLRKDSEDPKKSRRFRYWLLGVVVIILILPYPDRVGGDIDIFPPRQQQLQAPLPGQVKEVFYKGGDGTLIKQGTLVARMVFDDVENAILLYSRQIEEKKAQLDRAKDELAKLLAGSLPEQINEAKAQLAAAAQEVDVANAQLHAAKATAIYALQALKMIQPLYDKGFASLLQLNEAKSKSEIADIEVTKNEQNLSAKEEDKKRAQAHLNLVVQGPRPEVIAAARQACESAEAELHRVDQQLAYAKHQQSEGELKMPFDGVLIDPFLDHKIGSYLHTGDSFATAQENAQKMIVVYLPEYEAGKAQIGFPTEIKLFAYKDSPIHGKVISIQPASTSKPASTAAAGNVFEAVIQLEKTSMDIEPGMEGYGKIDVGWNPLGYILARPLIRFCQVQVWSWLP
jgi:putative peptide zinc metalloprotease protein